MQTHELVHLTTYKYTLCKYRKRLYSIRQSVMNTRVCVCCAVCVRAPDVILGTVPVGKFLARSLILNDEHYRRHRGTHKESQLPVFLFERVKRSAMLIMGADTLSVASRTHASTSASRVRRYKNSFPERKISLCHINPIH